VRVHGQTARYFAVKFGSLIALLLGIVFAMPGLLAQTAVKPIKTTKGEFALGPYPTPFDLDGIKTHFWTWLVFSHSTEGSGNGTHKLGMKILMQIDHLSEIVGQHAAKKLPSDNCGRYGIDNWVYSLRPSPLGIAEAGHVLRIGGAGKVQTWTCARPLSDGVKCETYRDSLGLTWPKNCRTVRGDPMKTMNVEAAFEVHNDFYLNTRKDGALEFRDRKPFVVFPGERLGIFNILASFNNLASAMSNVFFSPQTLEINVPEDFKAFKPRYEAAGFEKLEGKEHLVVSAAARIPAAQANAFMSKHFGTLTKEPARIDTGASLISATIETPVTQSLLREQCHKFAPNEEVTACAEKMGWPYELLPQ
jgi:hypothetical protein